MPKPPEPPELEIHRAARIGDAPELRRLLGQGVDVNMRCDLEVDNGPHLRQLTPLMVAARSIDGATVETLRLLLSHGADLRAVSEGGETAAWYAAGKGGRWEFHDWRECPDHVDRLRFLLDAGLDPNECSFNGRSLLVEACWAGDPARVQLLLERGVPANPTFDPGENARQMQELRKTISRESGSDEWAKVLFDFDGLNSYQIPLFCAAESGSGPCVRLLLDGGAVVDQRDGMRRTALMHARSAAVVQVLLSGGADLRATANGVDALQAILVGHCESGCDPRRFEAADALLKAGANLQSVDQFDVDGRLCAVARQHVADAVDYLLKKGASPSANALFAICWQGEYEDETVNNNCQRIIESLVGAGVDPNETNEEGFSALHEAALGDWGNPTAIGTLLRLGTHPDPAAHNGTTPLMLAATRGEVECIRLLLAAGADPQRTDSAGASALSLAADHLKVWHKIVRKPTDVGKVAGESDAAVADRHAKALLEAEQALELLKAARMRSQM